MKTLNLVLAVHIHQPVGNFDHVVDQSCNDAYVPFLDRLARHPSIRINLHVSGCLLERLEERRPDVLDRIRALTDVGQVQLVGGAFHEPILSMLPEADRAEQIARMQTWLKRRFRRAPRGAWLAERVWEPGLASTLADAGVEFVFLDDAQLLAAGLRERDLHGPWIAGDQGRLVRILPAVERLRYLIPYRPPQEAVEYLHGLASQGGDRVVVYADDGEKFGSWPGTHRHVYRDGWLDRFFQTLESNADWLTLITAEEAIDRFPPRGTVAVPESAYREMTEWALPPEARANYEKLKTEARRRPDFDALRPFLRGGVWRAFLHRYPESGQMYGRMIHLSRRIHALPPSPARERALAELHRAQCNGAYWHGVFGGLYLPHLRAAVYRHLIAAENALDAGSGPPREEPRGTRRRAAPGGATARRPAGVRIERADFDLDGGEEIALRTPAQALFLRPHRGGALYEWDLRASGLNLLNTLSRRPEAYHESLREAAESPEARGMAEGLENKLVYDGYARAGWIDHPWDRGISLGEVVAAIRRDDAPFTDGAYAAEVGRGAVTLRREARVGDGGPLLRIEKTLTPDPRAARIDVAYAVTAAAEPASLRFGVEFNFAMLGPGGGKTFYREGPGEDLGDFAATLELPPAPRFGLYDPVNGLDIRFTFASPAGVWTFPIETLSMSTEGLESLYQSSAVIPGWDLELEPGKTWTTNFSIEVGTI